MGRFAAEAQASQSLARPASVKCYKETDKVKMGSNTHLALCSQDLWQVPANLATILVYENAGISDDDRVSCWEPFLQGCVLGRVVTPVRGGDMVHVPSNIQLLEFGCIASISKQGRETWRNDALGLR